MKYDYKKTLKKALYGLGYVIVCGILYVITDKPQVAILIPVMIAVQNYLKHKLNWNWL